MSSKSQRTADSWLATSFLILDRDTIQIISHDSKELVDFIAKKEYTSLEVAQAYCKTAAVAHQIVRKNRVAIINRPVLFYCIILLMLIIRIIVYMRFSFIKHFKGRKSLMTISRKMAIK